MAAAILCSPTPADTLVWLTLECGPVCSDEPGRIDALSAIGCSLGYSDCAGVGWLANRSVKIYTPTGNNHVITVWSVNCSGVISQPLPLVEMMAIKIGEELEKCLQGVIDVTLANWRGPVEADLAVIFPLHPCNFACFQRTTYDAVLCALGGTDCFGIYKTQKGVHGFVVNAGIRVRQK